MSRPLRLVRRTLPVWIAFLGIALYAPRTFALPGDVPPRRLIIPSIGVDAPVESVGKTPDGNMGAPGGPNTVAWFNLGVAPGHRGNAVMAGHLDGRSGEPAVFWDLDEILPGSQVLVVDGGGATLEYRVTEVGSYRTEAAPLNYIFGPTGASRLNLVTCAGTWNRGVQRYSHRLVVFADLVGTGAPVAANVPEVAVAPISPPDTAARVGQLASAAAETASRPETVRPRAIKRTYLRLAPDRLWRFATMD